MCSWPPHPGGLQQNHPTRAAEPTGRPLVVPVNSIGAAAYRVLDGNLVRPFAAFERCAYVEAPVGKIACIGDATIGDGPLNAIVAQDYYLSQILRPGAGIDIAAELNKSKLWQSGTADRQAPDLSSWTLSQLRRSILPFALDQGLSPLLPLLLAGEDLSAPSQPLLARAWPAVRALGAWLRASKTQVCPVPRQVADLIGLGPGLTPSGDDVLGGCLVALRRRGHPETAQQLSDCVLPVACWTTGRISLAHLECAAEGSGHAALHAVIETLLDGSAENLVDQLSILDRVGHSSGWDALVGVVLALTAE